MDGLRDRAHGSRRWASGRRPNLDGMRDRLDEHGGWLAAARHRMRPWHAIPGGVAALALIIGGFWLGGEVGGHASAAVLTSTVKGKVITIDGSRFISTPAITVKVKGKTVHIPARTVKLPAHTVIKGKTVPVDVNRTVKVPVTVSSTDTQTRTVNHTVTTVRTTVQTVTGPTTTVFGSPVTITVPGPTVTVTVPSP
jgi:hypothetical protein